MICSLILAAGRSRRMGTQKLLLPVSGQPLIARIVDEVLRSLVDEALVVVGSDAARIAEALAGRRVRLVTNPDPEAEMLSSVRCGLRAMPEAVTGVLLVLGDQPRISAATIAALVRAFDAGDRGIVVPTCEGRRGHPLLFTIRYREEILTRYDEVGLRGLVHAHPEDILEVEVAARGILEDLDVPADYRRFDPSGPNE